VRLVGHRSGSVVVVPGQVWSGTLGSCLVQCGSVSVGSEWFGNASHGRVESGMVWYGPKGRLCMAWFGFQWCGGVGFVVVVLGNPGLGELW
jgi:hypothetical protein